MHTSNDMSDPKSLESPLRVTRYNAYSIYKTKKLYAHVLERTLNFREGFGLSSKLLP